jgi:hypothetical protein
MSAIRPNPFLIIVSLLALLPLPVMAQELIDPSRLNLQIFEVRRVTDVPCFTGEGRLSGFSPYPGFKGAIVVLNGRVPAAGRLILPYGGFIAVYDAPAGRGEKAAAGLSAVCVSQNGHEAFVKVTPETFFQQDFIPGSIDLRLLFYVPESVNSFHIMYPALLQGTATFGIEASR